MTRPWACRLASASESTSEKNMIAHVAPRWTVGAVMGFHAAVALEDCRGMTQSTTSYTGRSSRHRQVPSQKEPRGLTRDGTDKRVDGCTPNPWQCGKAITWDVTIPDTLAQSHLPKTSCVSGAAAEDASLRILAKYTGVRQRYDFVAIAVETRDPGPNEQGWG